MDNNNEIRAPGEKVDIRQESLYDYIQPNDMGSHVIPHTIDNTGTHSTRRQNQLSTAHITSDSRLSAALLNNRNAKFAYDELVLACAAFLGSPIINDTVTHFAENILTILEPPTALDSTEVKRRIEQVLPLNRKHKHHRGMSLSDKDCTRLCSLADRIINNAPYTNLNIVDEDEEEEKIEFSNNLRRASSGNVQYINSNKQVQQQQLPKQLPSFVEPNFELEGGGEYDLDITPYDSEVDEPFSYIIKMSCHSCGGCFTGVGCSTAKLSKKEIMTDASRFQSLLDLAASQDQLEHEGHDHVIPTIMSELSKNVYSSQTVLFKAHDELSLIQFLDLAKRLYTANVVGVHIAWAAEYCEGDVKQLLSLLKDGTEQECTLLLQHCDDQAEIHEMFGTLTTGSVGRVSVKQ